jgi:ADP-ribose pyrophosphatase YjhB (NUDIX family)
MAALLDPRFCALCGAPMRREVPPQDRRERPVCTSCGFVHYLDPKVACGTIAERDGRVILVQRNIDPRKGYWSFPCGFMEVDETAEQAALRETREETGLEVELGPHLGTYSYPDSFYGGSVVVVVYHARVVGGTLCPDDDACDARWVDPSEIPWERLAFRSSEAALRDWLRLKGLRPA